jgi:signal transduction histidine kinase
MPVGSGAQILKDYRNIDVYSSYEPLEIGDLNWVILSEIDVEEVTIPLQEMKRHLYLIFLMVMAVAALLSVLISRLLSHPILYVRDQLKKMSLGDFNPSSHPASFLQEVSEMIGALEELKKSIRGAIRFSQNLGEMNLASKYEPTGQKDILGQSLLRMQQQLLQYKSKEVENRKEAQKQLMKGQEQERERLSKELHDGIGPLLTGLKFLFQTEKEETLVKEKAVELIDQTIDDVRRMTYALMPPAIRDFGVGKALIHFTNLIARSTRIDIQYYDGTKDKNSQIDNDLGISIFRIVQELVNNTVKHAEASIIRITLTEFDDYCSLDYFDNGKGFDMNVVQKGAGFRNIAERIDVFNGELNVESGKEGTRVEIEIPMNV